MKLVLNCVLAVQNTLHESIPQS